MIIEPIIAAVELQGPEPGAVSKHQQDVVSYIADMLSSLRQMADEARLPTVVRSIDNAFYHAYAAQRGNPASDE